MSTLAVPTIIIYAPRVHTGGGLVLLRELLSVPGVELIAILDERLRGEDIAPAEVSKVFVQSGIKSYFGGERALVKAVRKHPQATVLCFSSLSPWRRLGVRTAVFVQNRFVLEDVRNLQFPFKRKLRLVFERMWFLLTRSNADIYFVQSISTARMLKAQSSKSEVVVLPFADDFVLNGRIPASPASVRDIDFVYVATSDPHKNHRVLLDTWQILANDGLFPSLGLTIPADDDLGIWRAAEDLNRSMKTRIMRLEPQKERDRGQFYERARALIFPSLIETYGLPLIEAQALGLPILASELDFVRDSVDPVQTFDPKSPLSVARAVKRWLGKPESPARPVSASQFLATLVASKNGH